MIACRSPNCLPPLKFLLDRKNCQDFLDAVDARGRTALHFACQNPAGTEAVDLLLQNGVSADPFSEDGLCPIHVAIKGGNLDSVKILMKFTKINGKTLLQWANQNGQKAIVDYLFNLFPKVIFKPCCCKIHLGCKRGRYVELLPNRGDEFIGRTNSLHLIAIEGGLKVDRRMNRHEYLDFGSKNYLDPWNVDSDHTQLKNVELFIHYDGEDFQSETYDILTSLHSAAKNCFRLVSEFLEFEIAGQTNSPVVYSALRHLNIIKHLLDKWAYVEAQKLIDEKLLHCIRKNKCDIDDLFHLFLDIRENAHDFTLDVWRETLNRMDILSVSLREVQNLVLWWVSLFVSAGHGQT